MTDNSSLLLAGECKGSGIQLVFPPISVVQGWSCSLWSRASPGVTSVINSALHSTGADSIRGEPIH